MTPIQQLMLGVGASEKTYLDDVFSTYVYTGTGSARSINNGIDLAGEGGMAWFKSRSGTYTHGIFDTETGAGKILQASSTAAITTDTTTLSAFNNNGFSLGTDQNYGIANYDVNNGVDYASWTFRKAPGFFDVVTYTGNGTSGRTISHSLGCVPGFIMVKCTSHTEGWEVYHRSIGPTKQLTLNSTDSAGTSSSRWNDTQPTSSVITLGDDGAVNNNGRTYVAYVFAGGESTAATATSVDLSGQEGLDIAASSSMNLGTGQFCVEGWIYLDDAPGTGSPTYGRIFQLDGPTVNSADSNLQITIQPSDKTAYIQNGANSIISGTTKLHKKWNHIAVTRVSNTITLYVNGVKDGTASTAQDFNPNSGSPRVRLGYADGTSNNNGVFEGKISNFRITTGEAVYTSAFKVPTEPLTTTSQGVTASNVKLLCCNGSSTTSSTVTPGTITAAGSPATSTDSPFDDPDAFTFGNSKEGIIKCGTYLGSSSGDFRVYLGWEPQWIMIKRTDGSANWALFDSMRGIVTEGNENYLYPNLSNAEYSAERISLTATGFIVDASGGVLTNNNNERYIYMAIRRPDGYVGKPADAGTDVFTMDTGSSSSTIPTYDSGFPVAFALWRTPAAQGNWNVGARLIGNHVLSANLSAAEQDDSNGQTDFDSNLGFGAGGGLQTSSSQAWMWKRHAGFDVVTYEGNGSAGHVIPHSMNKIPEMMWIRRRNATEHWEIYHKGLNGGTNPQNYGIKFFDTAEHSSGSDRWNAPTATSITVNTDNGTNNSSGTFIAMLFASVSGISSVGSYTGNGSSSGPTITTGFTPRFILIKSVAAESWYVLDTSRGLGTSSDKLLRLDKNNAELAQTLNVTTSSTGFTIIRDWAPINQNNTTMLYYAHA